MSLKNRLIRLIQVYKHIIIQVKYLVGAADQFEDVHLWMWFSVVCQ